MGKTGRISKVLFTLIITISCLMLLTTKPTSAQSIPKPSIPEFTLRYIDSSYDVPASYSTNQYTGEQTLIETAHHVYNGTIQLWITNQKYTYSNGSTFHAYYLYRCKGHFGTDWNSAYSLPRCLVSSNSSTYATFIADLPSQSDSLYTVLTHNVQLTSNSTSINSPNILLDFAILEIVGHDAEYFMSDQLFQFFPPYTGSYANGVAYDISSDWSNTQTINLTDGSVSASASSDSTILPTPTIPELSWLVVVPLLLSIFSIAVIVRHRRVSKATDSV